MKLEPVLTQIDTNIEAQLRWADPAAAEMASGFVEALRPAIRAAILEAAQQVAAEISAQLGDRRVEVRLVDGDPELVVSPAPDSAHDAAEADASAAEEMEARITLRLPSNLKGIIEEAASTSGDSINSWVVDALKSRARRSNVGSRVEETFQL